MPEGPELYMSAQFINQTCRNNLFSGQIFKSAVSRQPDIDWNEETYTISAVTRGKELKLTLQSITNDKKENKKCSKKQNKTLDIVFQFGMSGKFDFYEANELQKHAHLNFYTKTENNKSIRMVLSFVDYRRFGKWQPNGNWSVERGPCVLTDYIPFRENILKNVELSVFRKPICEVLLNQKYFNGIGNYLRAEICYRGGILPFQDARSVLEPLLTETNEVKIKSEKPDILQLCHLLPNEVINLGGTGYDPENRDPDYSKFTEWLQCYYKPGMKNMADHNKRTMWYDGNPGPLKPSVEKVRKIKRKKKVSEEVEKTVLKEILQEPVIKITEAKDVRWLSHDKAVQSIRRCFPSIITSLEREAKERGDAQALGLATFVQKFDFIATLYMMCDLLPPLSQLSKALQRKDADYTVVRPLVTGTIKTIQSFKERHGENYASVRKVIDDLIKENFKVKSPTEEEFDKFERQVYFPYIDHVVENLEKRFPDLPLLESFSVFDPISVPEDPEEADGYGREQIGKLKVEKIEHDIEAETTEKSKRTRKTATGPITRKIVTEEESLKKSKKKSAAKAKNTDLEKSTLEAAGKRRATRRKLSKTSVSDTSISVSSTPKHKMSGNTVRRTRQGKRS